MSVFARFSPRLQEAIVARLGWTSLRPVQEEAGEALLRGDNAVVLAPTAGGKTEASMFPTLSGMVDRPPEGVGALYIAPIKALLNNQSERLDLYTEMVGLRRFVWHGDTTTHARKKFLREPTELLMTTPESLEVMLVSQSVNEAKLFGDLRMVIIDEIHALAGTDRGAHLMSVLERLARVARQDVQRVGLSATVGNPEAILAWLQGTSTRDGRVVNPPKPPSRRELMVLHREDLSALAGDAARVARGSKSLFFCQSRSTTEAVAEHMRRSGTTVFVHHSAVSREERQLAEERFHHGSDACIVCTSTLELGIDVGDLDRVLQAEAPDTVSSFMQRMGRTGRRVGQAANTSFFCETTEGVLQAVALIELAKSRLGRVRRARRALLAGARPPAHDDVPRRQRHQRRGRMGSPFEAAGSRRHRPRRVPTVSFAGCSPTGAYALPPGCSCSGQRQSGVLATGTSWSSSRSSRAQKATPCRTGDGQPLGTLNQDFVDPPGRRRELLPAGRAPMGGSAHPAQGPANRCLEGPAR